MAAKGNHTIAVVKGKEDYATLKPSFGNLHLTKKGTYTIKYSLYNTIGYTLHNNINDHTINHKNLNTIKIVVEVLTPLLPQQKATIKIITYPIN